MESIIPGTEKRDLLYLRKARAYGPAPLSSRHTEKGRRQARAYGVAMQRVP